MRIKNKKSKKILLTVCIVVVILISVGLFFVSRYLVNYAIGRSGDGGDRQVSLDVEEPTDGVEKTIADNKKAQEEKMYSRDPRGRTRNAIGLQERVGSNPTIFAISSFNVCRVFCFFSFLLLISPCVIIYKIHCFLQ